MLRAHIWGSRSTTPHDARVGDTTGGRPAVRGPPKRARAFSPPGGSLIDRPGAVRHAPHALPKAAQVFIPGR